MTENNEEKEEEEEEEEEEEGKIESSYWRWNKKTEEERNDWIGWRRKGCEVSKK